MILPNLAPLIFVFIASLFPAFDPDLGWHLKYGQYFLGHGQVLRENTFSSALPDFRWVNISWGLDVIDYLVFSATGFVGLSLLAAAVITVGIFFMIRISAARSWELVFVLPIFLWVNRLFFAASFRGQILSVLYFSLLLYLLSRAPPRGSKLFLPLLFLVWANTHGSFALGLLLSAAWLAASGWASIRPLAASLVLAIAVSAIHPYGPTVFAESLQFKAHPSLPRIMEWKSPLEKDKTALQFLTLVSLLLVSLLIPQVRRQISLPLWASVILLAILSFSALRYVIPLTVFSFPVLIALFRHFRPPGIPPNSRWLSVVFFGLSLFVFIYSVARDKFWIMDWDYYCSYGLGCSPAAARFIISSGLNTPRLLSPYDLGGWLIWNYPEITPYVDGRMHLWSQNGFSPFAYFNAFEQGRQDIDTAPFDSVFTTTDKPLYFLLEQKTAAGSWTKVFSDATTAVFTRRPQGSP